MQDGQQSLVDALQAHVAGLSWMSESDYPFRVVVTAHPESRATESAAASTNEIPPLRPVGLTVATEVPIVSIPNLEDLIKTGEPVDLDTFFQRATQAQDWFGEAEWAIAQRYQQLVCWLKENLTNLQVYRCGDVEVDIYILGQTADGTRLGLQTRAIET